MASLPQVMGGSGQGKAIYAGAPYGQVGVQGAGAAVRVT